MKSYFNIKWYTFFYTLAFTGLRRGEITAIQQKDVSFDNQTLSINKTVTIDKKGDQYVSNSTKTRRYTSIIKVPNFVMKQLKEYYKYCIKNKKNKRLGISK